MTPDAAERLRVYQEGQRSARTEDAECPYRQSDWRSRTWLKGRVAAMEYHKAMMLEAAECDRRAAIEPVEPVQEPVAWIQPDHLQKARVAPFLCRVEPTQRCADFVPLYLAPPQRKPLTEEEMYAVEEEARKSFRQSQKGVRGQQITYWDGLTPWLIRAVERAHGIKE